MTELRDLYEVTKDGIVVHVHVQPGAGRSAVVGRHGDALKVRVAAPPVEGRANDATASLLAEALGVSKGDVELVSGSTSRLKRFRVTGIELEDLEQRLELAMEEGSARPGPRAHRR